ncbi:MAG: DUF4332 domain-containing protein [Hyphomicrobiaceae bacterium]
MNKCQCCGQDIATEPAAASTIWIDDALMACCNQAHARAVALRAQDVSVLHLLHAAASERTLGQLLDRFGLPGDLLRARCAAAEPSSGGATLTGRIATSDELRRLLAAAQRDATAQGRETAGIEDVLRCLLWAEIDLPAARLVRAWRLAFADTTRTGIDGKPRDASPGREDRRADDLYHQLGSDDAERQSLPVSRTGFETQLSSLDSRRVSADFVASTGSAASREISVMTQRTGRGTLASDASAKRDRTGDGSSAGREWRSAPMAAAANIPSPFHARPAASPPRAPGQKDKAQAGKRRRRLRNRIRRMQRQRQQRRRISFAGRLRNEAHVSGAMVTASDLQALMARIDALQRQLTDAVAQTRAGSPSAWHRREMASDPATATGMATGGSGNVLSGSSASGSQRRNGRSARRTRWLARQRRIRRLKRSRQRQHTRAYRTWSRAVRQPAVPVDIERSAIAPPPNLVPPPMRFHESGVRPEAGTDRDARADIDDDHDDFIIDDEAERDFDDAASDKEKRFYLSLDDDIVRAPSIGPRTADRLNRCGIVTVRDLLNCDASNLAGRLRARHITAARIVEWQHQARLVCTIPWLRGTHAQLLVGASYPTLTEILQQEPGIICGAILSFAGTRDGQRVLRAGPPPDVERILQWIERAHLAEPQRAA